MAHTEEFKKVLEVIKKQANEFREFGNEQKSIYILNSFRGYLVDEYLKTYNESIAINQYIGGLLCKLDDLEGKEDVFETVNRLSKIIEKI